MGRRAVRAADRLRQRRQPGAGAIARANEGAGDAARARRGALARRAAARHRERAAHASCRPASDSWSGYAALRLLGTLNIQELPRGEEIRLDGVVVAYTLAVAAVIGFVLGLIPVANVLPANLTIVLREEGRSGTAGVGARTLRRALVVAQVGFAFVLLVGAGLLFASFRQVMAVDPGFNVDGVLTASINLPRSRYGTTTSCARSPTRRCAACATLPGVVGRGRDRHDSVRRQQQRQRHHRRGLPDGPGRVGHLAESGRGDARVLRGDGRQAGSRPFLRRARRAEGPADGDRRREARQALLAEPGSDWAADVPAAGHQQPAGGHRQDRLPLRRRRDPRRQAARADRGQADGRRLLLSDGAEHVERDDVRGEDRRRSAGALEQRPRRRCPSSIASCRCTTFRRWMRGWRGRW